MSKLHVKCRHPNEYVYRNPESGKKHGVVRTEVPNNYVDWDNDYTMYDPLNFTAAFVLTASWADPELDKFQPKWNEIDGNINRKSHEGEYNVILNY